MKLHRKESLEEVKRLLDKAQLDGLEIESLQTARNMIEEEIQDRNDESFGHGRFRKNRHKEE